MHIIGPTWQRTLAASALCLALWLAVSRIYFPTNTTSPTLSPDFSWSRVVPQASLAYRRCFGDFQCARLSVPLDWNNASQQHDAAAVAVIKLPATVPVTDPRYGGPVVLNPGGPGESGVRQVLADAKHIQSLLDAPGPAGRRFDILSFDPRGVNNTTPPLSCFPDARNQQAWLSRSLDVGLLWDSDSVAGLEWARAAALGASCSAPRGQVDILPYLNTAQVVEDMVHIIESEGEWRAKEAQRLLGMGHPLRQPTSYHPGQEKIQFWGMSYGTTIGATFAAMHPDRVRRLVLDGNMDPADHYAGAFEHSLQDADKVIAKHAEYCHRAGPAKCPLYQGTSPQAIEVRFTAIMQSLKSHPIAVPLPGNLGPEILTYGDVHLSLLGSVYFPYALAELFWDLLPALEARNASHPWVLGLAKRKQALVEPAQPPGGAVPTCDPTAGGGDDHSCQPYHAWAGAFAAVSCTDAGGGPSSLTREAFSAHRAELAAQSRWVSPTWSRNKLMCEGITVAPAWRPLPRLRFEKQEWANTSHPLLLIGNTRDPATPLANAARVSRDLFPTSVVLQQDSEGHCSHATPSLCTAKIVREYFQTGTLPRPGTVCHPEKKPFLGCVREGGCHFDEEDARLWEALHALADTYGFSKRRNDQSHMHLWGAHLRNLRI